MITLKEHNVKPYAQLCEMLVIHQKCAYIAATGTGKSYVVGKYIEDHDLVDKTLVLVPSKAIKDAWEKLLPGLSVITYQKLYGGGYTISEEKVIVCDEMHHLGAAEWGRVYSAVIKDFYGKVIGITATPVRFLDKSRNMAEEFFDGNTVEGLNLPEAISAGILPNFEYITALYNLPCRKLKENQKNETTERLIGQLDFMENAYSFQKILSKHLDAGKHKVAVFVNDISALNEVKNLCQETYPGASHYVIHSQRQRGEVKNEIARFENDDGLSFLYSVNMFNEGVHINGVDTVIMFRKTGSPNIYLQQIGRALSSDNKGHRVKIFDFVANHRNLKAILGEGQSVISWIQNGISDPERQIVVCDYAMEEIEVLDRLRLILNGCLPWSEDEDKILRENYDQGKGVDKTVELLKHRTRKAVRARAEKIGVVNRVIRDKQILEDVRVFYPRDDGTKILLEKYPFLTVTKIKTLAAKVGVRKENYYGAWTPEEDQVILDHPDMTVRELMELIPTRTKSGITTRRQALGIKVEYEAWRDEYDEILKEHNDISVEEIQARYLPQVGIGRIRKRRRALGLKQENYWNEQRSTKFRELYSAGGYKSVLTDPEFADMKVASICSAAARLGVKSRHFEKGKYRHERKSEDEGAEHESAVTTGTETEA